MILIAAVVVGAISAFLVFNYVNSADSRARAGAREVDILKVQSDVQKGLSGREAIQQSKIVHAKIPAEFKPQTAITDESIIADKVAVANYTTGQILVDGMFADPIDNQITFAGRIPSDCGSIDPATNKPAQCVAVTISVDQVHGVAGVVVPGDLVNMLVLPEGGNGSANSAASPARVLYQAARVLMVDKTAVPQPGEVTQSGTNTATPSGQAQTASNSGLITLEVPAKAAQLIASISPGRLYLTLLPPNYTPESLPQQDAYPAVLPGEDASQLTPYGPNGIQNQR
jgi:pilus assembly protein CpaB